jgi:hypothetical protein
LFAGFGSNWSPRTIAVFVNGPRTLGVPTILTVTVAPTARLPSKQVSVTPESVQVPCVAVEVMKKRFGENESMRVTPVAGEGPLLTTVTVKVRGLPTRAGFGEAVFVTARSADGAVTMLCTVA